LTPAIDDHTEITPTDPHFEALPAAAEGLHFLSECAGTKKLSGIWCSFGHIYGYIANTCLAAGMAAKIRTALRLDFMVGIDSSFSRKKLFKK
jgi:hypothetical protein